MKVTERRRSAWLRALSNSRRIGLASAMLLAVAVAALVPRLLVPPDERENIFAVPPREFAGLVDVLPSDARPELIAAGEYRVVAVSELCRTMGCEVTQSGDAYTITRGAVGLRWVRGQRIVQDLDLPEPIALPTRPEIVGAELVFPIRILAERLGFNTTFDAAMGVVRVFALADRLRSVPLVLERTIEGSDLPLHYLIASHESADEFFVLYDLSHEIVAFRKTDFSYSRIAFEPRHGVLRTFAVAPDGTMYVGTSLGTLLAGRPGSFRVLTAAGGATPGSVGATTDLGSLRLFDIFRFALSEDGQLLYVLDAVLGTIGIDLRRGTATLLAGSRSVDGALFVASHEAGVVVGYPGRLLRIDSVTLASTDSPCYSRLFGGKRIYGVHHVMKGDLWLAIDGAGREIVEARLTFGANPAPCRVVRTTSFADETTFLNGFGTLDPVLGDQRAVVMDSDGFNLVTYAVGGSATVITKEEFGSHANLRWVLPMALVEREGALYVVANLSHRVFRYDLRDGRIEPYAGNGTSLRDESAVADRLEIGLGYPSFGRLVDGRLVVADHLNRRLVSIEDGRARALFPSTDPSWMAGVSGFDRSGEITYLADTATGLLFSHRPGAARPERAAGVYEAEVLTDSELVRRRAARGSIEAMTTFETVNFGLPVGVAALPDGRLLVSDVYRHGLWLLDPRTRAVSRAAGLLSHVDYHFGSFVGNVGLGASDLRLASPYFVMHDDLRGVLTVPAAYGRALVFVRDDLAKTCVATTGVRLELPTQAIFLRDGRLAVVDMGRNRVHIFQPPDLGCLRTPVPPR